METPSFQLNAVWQAKSTTNNESFNLSYYNGGCSFALFSTGKGSSNRPLAKFNMPAEACIRLAQLLRSLIKEKPDTRQAFYSSQFNRDTRQFETGTGMTMVFVKDDRRCYQIEITSKSITTPITIKCMASQSFSTDGTTRSDDARSEDKILALIDVLEHDLMLRSMSRFGTREQQQANRNRNGGGGNYRGRGTTQHPDPYGSKESYNSNGSYGGSNGGSDEDIPF